jgi:hypothetical protein
LTFDASAGVIVMAGGRRGTALYGDTWTFDGTRWRETTDTTLSPRYVYDLAYDDRRAEVVFYGGGFMRHGRWALHDDTWARRSDRWTRARAPDGDRAPVASERCYRFDRFHFQWVAAPAGGSAGSAPQVDSANVISLVDVIHRTAPRTLPPDESPWQKSVFPASRATAPR